jgi:aldose 1-epimerase
VAVYNIAGPGGTVAEVLAVGATLHRLRVPAGGRLRDVVLSLPADERARSGDFIGTSIGRYANRIGGGTFTLDGVEHRVPVNDRGNALHGGAGFDRRTWSWGSWTSSHVELTLVSEDGDQGFPGRLSVTCRYELLEVEGAPTLRTTYTATTDAPTVVSLTSHPYFNLDGALPATSAAQQRLSVAAGTYLPVDESGLPTGEVACVEGTAYDLRVPRPVGELPPIDHTYVVDADGMRPVASMWSTSGDIALELWSDQPGVHVFTASTIGAAGQGHPQPGTGVALEPQHFPDSVHHPEWPSTVLRPGDRYRWVSEARFVHLEG